MDIWRVSWVVVALVFAGCGEEASAPVNAQDSTNSPQYVATLKQLTQMVREAESDQKAGNADDASALIEKAEPLASQLLSVHQPTLEAMEAASDLDDLYGRMLLASKHYAWAQFLFQKNLARWKHWTPATEQTAARLQQAQLAIAACERGMMK